MTNVVVVVVAGVAASGPSRALAGDVAHAHVVVVVADVVDVVVTITVHKGCCRSYYCC